MNICVLKTNRLVPQKNSDFFTDLKSFSKIFTIRRQNLTTDILQFILYMYANKLKRQKFITCTENNLIDLGEDLILLVNKRPLCLATEDAIMLSPCVSVQRFSASKELYFRQIQYLQKKPDKTLLPLGHHLCLHTK